MHKFQLINDVSSRWKEFGVRLGMSLSALNGLDHKHRGSSRDIWIEVMDYWLVNGEECGYSSSWSGLYELLGDIDLSQVAANLERAVKGHCSQSS